MHRLDHTVRREVAESGLELVLMEVVEYFLRGPGTHGFVVPAARAAAARTFMDEDTSDNSTADVSYKRSFGAAGGSAAVDGMAAEDRASSAPRHVMDTHGIVAPGGTAAAAGTVMEVRSRLESLGFDVGSRLVERYAMERERLEADLDIVKFICKDFWEQTFKKQVDVLKTNHKGLYVLTDNNFRWLARVSVSGSDHPGTPEDYLLFPCGLVCGALSRLGLKCRVTAEIVPDGLSHKCSFHVQVIQS
jgi:trafficking protein particle complex subunit 6